MTIKPKMTVDELVDNHLSKKKKMQFNIIEKAEAKRILKESNYYYKLGSYRKNFSTRATDGSYINLEFAYLVDLSKIDMQLRYTIIKFCLDIEHALKTKILKDITENCDEDGYSIVGDFFKYYNEEPDNYIGFLSTSRYSKKMYEKNKEHPSIWFLMETFNFGNLSRFVEFYYERTGDEYYKMPSNVIRYVKNIRNRAAHNYPIIYDITDTYQLAGNSRSKYVTKFISEIDSISKNSASKRLGNAKIHDLTAMFLLYDYSVNSKDMRHFRYKDIKYILDRCKRSGDYYKSHAALKQVYKYFDSVVDRYKSDWYIIDKEKTE